MILDKSKAELEQAYNSREEHQAASPSYAAAAPPSYPNASSPSSSSSPNTASASSYPRDVKAPIPPPTLPFLFPPLYAPSQTSPFLLAYPPALGPQVNEAAFLALVRAINSSLKKSPTAQYARTAENLIADVPGLNIAYTVTKATLGGILLGVASGTAAIIEGGHPNGPATRKMGQISKAYWSTPLSTLPPPTLSLLQLANSPSGPFPPSSNLCLTILPFSALPNILAQYPDGPLPDVPASVARALMSSANEMSGKEVGAERKKALRVRGRVDFKKWGFVRLEREETPHDPEGPLGGPKNELDFVPVGGTRRSDGSQGSPPNETRRTLSPTSSSTLLPTSSSTSATSTSTQRPQPATSASSSSNRGMFAHVDEKLAARRSRRALPPRPGKGVDPTGGMTDPGYRAGEGKVGEGTWFLVLVRRGLEGLEDAPGLEVATPGDVQGPGGSGAGSTGNGVEGEEKEWCSSVLLSAP